MLKSEGDKGSCCLPRLAAAALAASLVGLTGHPAKAQQSLTVASYGGAWGEGTKKCIADPFTQQTGIQVTLEPSVGSVTLGKLRQQKDDPVFDIAFLDGGVSELAMDLTETIDEKTVPNVADLIPEGSYKRADGTIYAVSNGFYSNGIVYNTEQVETPPESWWDLWKPEYQGLVMLPGPGLAASAPFVVHIANLLGGSDTNIEPALQKLKTLKVTSYYESSGAAANTMQSGESTVGLMSHSVVWNLADGGFPASYVVPKEGALGNDQRLHIVRGSRNLAAAQKFINYAISKEAFECLAETIYVGPAVKDAKLSQKAKDRMPWGPTGSIKSLVLFDWNKLIQQRDNIIEQYSRQVVQN